MTKLYKVIKLSDILKEITEGKQVGTLYHYTNNYFLKKIIETNTLEAPISFTRSKDKKTVFWIGAESSLVIDGDKLSTRYKIRPYQSYDEEGRFFDEMEERVDKNIINLDQYLIKVILYKTENQQLYSNISYSEIESLLKEKNIPYEIQ